jgi:Zn-dependent protease/CBS domain-containing protein
MRELEFYKRQMVLGRVSGIPVRADVRWFLVLFLMTGITAVSIEPLVKNLAGSVVLGFLTTIGFFVSIFLHEFAHAVMARFENLQVVALLMTAASSAGMDILWTLLFLLALANFLLAVFNLFPGYPLDGGRVLRAYLWRNGKDLNEATILTGRCGQVIAAGLIVLGAFFVIARGQFFTGFWAMLTGFFLFDSARSIIGEVRSLEKRLVGDVMTLPVAIAPEAFIQHVIDNILPMNRQAAFPVAQQRQLYGILLLEDVKNVPREDWRKIAVRDVMRPIATEHFVEAGMPLVDARELMRTNGVGALGVIDEAGNLVGFMTKKG